MAVLIAISFYGCKEHGMYMLGSKAKKAHCAKNTTKMRFGKQ